MQVDSKTSLFFKKIFSNPILYLWFGVFLFCFIFIFNFRGIADFRDSRFLLNPHNFIFKSSFYTANYWIHQAFWLWTKLNFSIPLFWNFFYSLIFSFGWILSFIFLKKTVEIILLNQTKPNFNLNLAFFLLVGLFYFNPYILERFFMGHYYVLWGHSIFIPCLYFVLKWFQNALKIREKRLLTLKNWFQKDFWYLLTAITFSQIINVHHGVFLLYFLSVCIIILFVFNLLQNFSKGFKKAILKSIFTYFNLQFLLIAVLNILIFSASHVFRGGFNTVNFYINNIQGSQNKFEIISSFSLLTLTNSITEHIIIGSLGLGNWMNPIAEIQAMRQDLGFWTDFTLQYNFFGQFLLFLILIIFVINLINTIFSNSSFKKSAILILIFSSFLITYFLNFGYSHPFFTTFNQFFYNFIPGFYTFREPGKFYSFFLAFLTILIAFQIRLTSQNFDKINTNLTKENLNYLDKNNDKGSFKRLILKNFKNSSAKIFFTNLFLILLLISNLIPFLLISKHLNYVSYPEIFNTANQYCQQNPGQKFIFLPLEIYLIASYSPRIFTGNPSSFYFKDCDFMIFNKVNVQNGQTGEVFSLNETEKSQQFDFMIENLLTKKWESQEFNQNLEIFLKENEVNNILIETYSNNKVKTINQALQEKYKLKKQEKTIFWYQIF